MRLCSCVAIPASEKLVNVSFPGPYFFPRREITYLCRYFLFIFICISTIPIPNDQKKKKKKKSSEVTTFIDINRRVFSSLRDIIFYPTSRMSVFGGYFSTPSLLPPKQQTADNFYDLKKVGNASGKFRSCNNISTPLQDHINFYFIIRPNKFSIQSTGRSRVFFFFRIFDFSFDYALFPGRARSSP